MKVSNKAKKYKAENVGSLALLLLELFKKQNDNAKKLINYDLMKESAKNKDRIIREYINASRDQGKWFYLASSHGDCAEDHKDYQGKLYIDRNAPASAMDYARKHGLLSLQWVMEGPVWFVTRPNCRHYFVALTEDEIQHKSLKKLRRKYKTHNKEGLKEFATPQTIAIEEYTDRLKMLRALGNEYMTDKIKADILKTEMLLKKWKNK